MDGPQFFSDTIEPVLRENEGDLFFLTIEARPEPGAEDFGQVVGAFVNCWVDAGDLRSAERRAVSLIQGYGWRPHRFESWEIVNRETYADRTPTEDYDFREVVDQAFVDGEIAVFHQWPADAPDAAEDH